MIQSKSDYRYYCQCDKIALGKRTKFPRIGIDVIWKYQIVLRKCEYYHNCGTTILDKILLKFWYFHLCRYANRLGFSIGLNTCGPGLAIVHHGLTVINQHARLGANCRIHEGVTIGSNASAATAPQIGDNVYIGSGAKIIGDIRLADGIVVGANAVVVHSFDEKNITIAGVPAKKVSEKGSDKYLIRATEKVGEQDV